MVPSGLETRHTVCLKRRKVFVMKTVLLATCALLLLPLSYAAAAAPPFSLPEPAPLVGPRSLSPAIVRTPPHALPAPIRGADTNRPVAEGASAGVLPKVSIVVDNYSPRGLYVIATLPDANYHLESSGDLVHWSAASFLPMAVAGSPNVFVFGQLVRVPLMFYRVVPNTVLTTVK